jgi:uncharacterized phage protein (TIGR02218 family)
MTYDARESSVESGNPVELYQFNVGSETFRYTSSQSEILASGSTWDPIDGLERGRVARTTDDKEDRVQVSMPADDPFASLFILIAPGNKATLTIYRVHRDDGNVITYFKGFIHGIGFSEDGHKAIFAVLPITSAKSQQIPRFGFQSNCNYTLFDSDCKISEATYTHDLTVTAVNNDVLTVSGAGALGADYFENGFVPFGGEYRLIIGQGGTGNNDLTLLVPFRTSPLNETLSFRAGCKHRLSEDCNTKFSNAINFGGFAFVPTKNPFETGLD